VHTVERCPPTVEIIMVAVTVAFTMFRLVRSNPRALHAWGFCRLMSASTGTVDLKSAVTKNCWATLDSRGVLVVKVQGPDAVSFLQPGASRGTREGLRQWPPSEASDPVGEAEQGGKVRRGHLLGPWQWEATGWTRRGDKNYLCNNELGR
jgi:hypothetical protein